MKYFIFERPLKKGMQILLLLAILFLNLAPGGAGTAYAAGNDNFVDATNIVESTISFTDNLDVSTYGTEASEIAPPGICGNDNHDLGLGFQTAWYKITPLTAQLVSFDTIGSSYDTYIAVWKGTALNSLTFVACDDDTYTGFQSQVAVTFTQTDVNNGTTYYIQVAKYNCSNTPCGPGDPTLGGYDLVFNANFYNIDVSMNGISKGTYNVPSGEVRKQSYASVNTGPVLLTTLLQDQLISSMRVIYKVNSKNVSYSEMMGFPAEQAAEDYYFPWYTTSSSINSQLRIVNVGNQTTTAVVKINGVIKGSYSLDEGKSKLVVYSGVNSGPVSVHSTIGGVKLVVSMRVLYKYSGAVTSYSEMMGYPGDQLTNDYWFPWYKTASGLTSQLRIANVGSTPATVKVCLEGTSTDCSDGTIKATYTLAAGARVQVPVFTNTNKGPVRVYSTDTSADIVASMKQTYKVSGIPQSYSEMMGYPADQLATEYQFPWYTNNTIYLSAFRIVNVDDADSTDVNIYIGGNLQTPITLAAGASTVVPVSYSLDDGPVRVVNTNPSANIIVSMQVTFKQSGKVMSYSEFTGIPYFGTTPNTAYLFPWYTNNTPTKSELRFGYP
jgi:hypothetical protein